MSAIESLQSKFAGFPNKAPSILLAGQFQITPTAAASVNQSVNGYQFWNADRTRVLQVRLDGVTVSLLNQYTNFSDLESAAKDLWEIYSNQLKPKSVARIALRYINRITLTPPLDLKDFFLTGPEISPKLPQNLAGFLMRVELPDAENDCAAIITQILEPAGDKISLIFDIDVYQQVEIMPSDPSIWSTIAKLRDFKNRIFFESITDRLRRQFE